ncbi:MAG: redoxin domain-containing protein [Thermomicrobiales bacterium]|nr:redoxin domain-containing protein [Thermomicrobiales bacterium]
MDGIDVLLLLGRVALALVLLVSGVAKLFDLSGSRAALRSFGVPEPLTAPGSVLVPLVEIALAILLVPAATASWGALGALVLFAIYIAGMSYHLARGERFNCHCFGQLTTSEIGASTIVRNVVLGVIAAFVAYQGFSHGRAGSVTGMGAYEWLALALAIVALAALAAIGWLLVHVLGQNGRLLVRIERIENALDLEEEEDETPVGAPAPAFTLSGLSGETMTLDALRAEGKPVLLVFSDTACAPCNSLMPDIGTWQRELGGRLRVALISRGSVEENRRKKSEHGLTQVLIQRDREVADAYEVSATPSAIVVQANATIGSRMAVGPDAIRGLVQQTIGEPAAPAPEPAPAPAPVRRPAPRGLANIGKDAPVVELNDLDGEPVRLTRFAGHPTAVLFWNPGCGFCQRMLDDLKAWEANPPEGAPKLLVVSTGDADENRATGLTSPVVLDSGFRVGGYFGANGTPSAVLIDAEGKIASGLAVGGPTVISLLRNEAPELLDASGATADTLVEDSAAPEAPPAAPPPPRGLAVGTRAPKITLPDLEGKPTTLDPVHQGRTVLLFWNPDCGYCKGILPEIQAWEAQRGDDAPRLVLISGGTASANRAQELASPILLDANFSTGPTFGARGTPSAILINAKGRVASKLAVGGPNVMDLLQS